MYIVLCKNHAEMSVNKIKGAQFVVPSQNTVQSGYQTLATTEDIGANVIGASRRTLVIRVVC